MSIDTSLKESYKAALNITNLNNIGNDILFLQNADMNKNMYVSGNTYMDSIVANSIQIDNDCNIQNSLIVIGNITNTTIITDTVYTNELYCSTLSTINNLTGLSNSYCDTVNFTGDAICDVLNNTTLSRIDNISSNTCVVDDYTITNNLTINNGLYSETNRLNNVTNTSTIRVIDNMYSNSPSSVLSTINITTLNTKFLNPSNLYTDTDLRVINMTSSNIIFNDFCTVNSYIVTDNLNAQTCIVSDITEYELLDAIQDSNVPLWGFYNTGGIVKIKIDNILTDLILEGETTVTINKGGTYTDEGAYITSGGYEGDFTYVLYITAIYYNDINYLTNKILFTNTFVLTEFDSNLVGDHTIEYTSTNNYGNVKTINRTVTVLEDAVLPTITLLGDARITLTVGTAYVEAGVTYSDNLDDSLTLVTTGTVDVNTPGEYAITYSVTDSSNNTANVVRIVIVLNLESFSAYDFNNTAPMRISCSNNYDTLLTNDWYIEFWIYLYNTSPTNVALFDLSPQPYSDSNPSIFIFLKNRKLGVYRIAPDSTESNGPDIQYDEWTKIRVYYNHATGNLQNYINDVYTGTPIDISTNFSAMTTINNIALCNAYKFPTTYQFYGILSSFILVSNNTDLFKLEENFTDSVTSTVLTTTGIIGQTTRDVIIENTDPSTANLIFLMDASLVDNTTTQWIYDSDYTFIPHRTFNNTASITNNKNIYGWSRNGQISWELQDDTALKALNWNNGMTIEQWIYIENDFVPSATSTRMLLAGQSSLYADYDYGFILSQGDYSYITYPDNILSFSSNILYNNSHGTGCYIKLDDLRGKWNCIAITSSDSELKLYLNGTLFFTYVGTTVFPNPGLSTSKFTIGSAFANGNIHTESYNKLYFGDVLLYNRILILDDITRNYNFYRQKYFIPTLNTKQLSGSSVPIYDLTNGYLTFTRDFNFIKSTRIWTFELWYFINIPLPIVNFLKFNNTSLRIELFNFTNHNLRSDDPSTYGDSGEHKDYNGWNHLAFVRTNNIIKIFCNGFLTRTFGFGTNESYLNYPVLGNTTTSNFNGIQIGSQSQNLKISQLKISTVAQYTSEFTPSFFIPQDENTVFLLDKDFTDIVTNKSITQVNTVLYIPSDGDNIELALYGTSYVKLYQNISTYNERGAYLRNGTEPIYTFNIETTNTVDVSTLGRYINRYVHKTDTKYLYNTRIIDVVIYDVPPTITLTGSKYKFINLNDVYNYHDNTVTHGLREVITPVITDDIDNNQYGIYTVTYTATDSYGNKSTATRTVEVINILLDNMIIWIKPTLTQNYISGNINDLLSFYDLYSNYVFSNQDGYLAAVDYTYSNQLYPNLKYFNSITGRTRSTVNVLDSNNSTFIIVFVKPDTATSRLFGHHNNNFLGIYFISINNDLILTTTNNTNKGAVVTLPDITNTPYMCTGVVSLDGLYIYLSVVNLITGKELSNSRTLTSTSNSISTKPIMYGTNFSNDFSAAYLGETMYWGAVLNSAELLKSQEYIYERWGSAYNNLSTKEVLPVLNIIGPTNYIIQKDLPYTDKGVTVFNPIDNDTNYSTVGTVDTTIEDDYTIIYQISTSLGTVVNTTRTVTVTSDIDIYIYEAINKKISLSNLNLSTLNNSDWTIEMWIYLDNLNDHKIFDLKRNTTSIASLELINSKITTRAPSNSTIIGNSETLETDKWIRVTWMRTTDNIYLFVNGIIDSGTTIPSYFNLINTVDNIDITINGKITQPLIESTAKYSIANFVPTWNIPLNISNLLFWFNNNDEIISNQTLVTTNITITTTKESPLIPFITLNSLNEFYIFVNEQYTDYGAYSRKYVQDIQLDTNITSILDNNNNELLSGNILVNTPTVVSEIITASETSYTITYETTDSTNGVTNSITRTVYVIGTNIYTYRYSSYIDTIVNEQTLGANWTVELWLFLNSYPNTLEYYSILYTNKFSILLDENGDVFIFENSTYTKLTNTYQLALDWNLLSVVYDNGTIKCFINGKESSTVSTVTLENVLINNYIVFSNDTYTRVVDGDHVQFLIINQSKYVADFLPVWYLNQSNDTTDYLYWLYNNIELVSTTIINNQVVILDKNPITPKINILGDDDTGIEVDLLYTDAGVTVDDYIFQTTAITPYITSITNTNGDEFVTTPFISTVDLAIGSELMNTNDVTIYTIEYTATGDNGIEAKAYRNVEIILSANFSEVEFVHKARLAAVFGFIGFTVYSSYYTGELVMFPRYNVSDLNNAIMYEIYRSTDGVNWTTWNYFTNNINNSFDAGFGITANGYINSRRKGGTPVRDFYYSPNGINWTYLNPLVSEFNTSYALQFSSCADIFWAYDWQLKTVWVSRNGTTWTKVFRTVPSGFQIQGMAFVNGVYTLFSRDKRFFTSTDTITWSSVKNAIDYLSGTPYQLSNFAAYGSQLKDVMSLPDGKAIISSYDTWQYSKENFIIISEDGINWTYSSIPNYNGVILNSYTNPSGYYPLFNTVYLKRQYITLTSATNNSATRYWVTIDLVNWELNSFTRNSVYRPEGNGIVSVGPSNIHGNLILIR